MNNKHIPVLMNEAISSLSIKGNGVYIDSTFGGGGYSREILKKIKNGLLVSFEIDASALIEYLSKIGKSDIKEGDITKLNKNHILVNRNFSEINDIMSSLKISEVDGIVADLGWSTNQIHSLEGLSFEKHEDYLDMRFNKNLGANAADLLNALGKSELIKLFVKYGDFIKPEASKLAKEIINTRRRVKFAKVLDLVKVIERLFMKINTRAGRNITQTKARVFQSLRIAVNLEYENLERLLEDGFNLLKQEGVMSIVTFHSGEEKIIENFTKSKGIDYEEVYPTAAEISENQKSRSAKLWILNKK
jgi:16S rRNA (cytosine1402-N4)-methyltransferase